MSKNIFIYAVVALMLMAGAAAFQSSRMNAELWAEVEITGTLSMGGIAITATGATCDVPDVTLAPGESVVITCVLTNTGSLDQIQFVYAQGLASQPLCSQFAYLIRDLDVDANLYTGQLTELDGYANKKHINQGGTIVSDGANSTVEITLTLNENVGETSANSSCNVNFTFRGEQAV